MAFRSDCEAQEKEFPRKSDCLDFLAELRYFFRMSNVVYLELREKTGENGSIYFNSKGK